MMSALHLLWILPVSTFLALSSALFAPPDMTRSEENEKCRRIRKKAKSRPPRGMT